jgi:tRNA1(Val) A37 N6-methylase TrmN6
MKFDKSFDIETTQKLDRTELDVSTQKKAHASSYHALDVGRFKRVMKSIPVDFTTYCFIDIGSGKGRVLFMADQLRFCRIIGVEFSQILHKIAEQNLKNYLNKLNKTRSEACIELFNCDALDFQFPAEPAIIFLFNPFDEIVMANFVKNLRQSIEISPRDIFLVYVHPTAENVFRESGYLHKILEDRKKDDYVIYKAG